MNKHLAPAVSMATDLSHLMSPIAIENSLESYHQLIENFTKKTRVSQPVPKTYREVKSSSGTLPVIARLNSVQDSLKKVDNPNQILFFVSSLEGSSAIDNFLQKHSDRSAYTRERLSKLLDKDSLRFRNDEFSFVSWNDRFQIKDIPVSDFSTEIQKKLRPKLKHFKGKEKLTSYVMTDILRYYQKENEKEVLVFSVRIEAPIYDAVITSSTLKTDSTN